MQTQEKFDLWCVVELFGHSKISGKCTEQNIAGANMLRVDVPETDKQPAFTRFFGSSAIYAINPVDEVTAKFYAEQLNTAPIISWQVGEIIEKHNKKLLECNISGNENLSIDSSDPLAGVDFNNDEEEQEEQDEEDLHSNWP